MAPVFAAAPARCEKAGSPPGARSVNLPTAVGYDQTVSSSDCREPTNDELWAQPPPAPHPGPTPQGLAPVPPPSVPAPAPSPTHYPQVPAGERPDRTVFVLAIVSIAIGIPLTAIAGGVAGLPGLIVAWVGIVLVNTVYAQSRRGH